MEAAGQKKNAKRFKFTLYALRFLHSTFYVSYALRFLRLSTPNQAE